MSLPCLASMCVLFVLFLFVMRRDAKGLPPFCYSRGYDVLYFLSAIKAHSLVTISGSPRSKLDRLAIEETYVHSPHHAEQLPADFI
ncbi:unnamed protein product [Prunus armeniaca]